MSFLKTSIIKNSSYIRRGIFSSKVLFEEIKLNANHKVNNFEKRCLVWTGKYKTIDEVPPFVAQEVMERARNRIRIRVSNILMVLTAIACFFIARSGKKLRDEGDSLAKRTEEWHKSLKENAT